MVQTTRDWAIVTPTYDLDFEQFKLMCESMDRFVVGRWHHYVLVNRADLPLFEQFNGPCRTVLENTKILPKWLHYLGKVPRLRSGNVFFSWRTGPFFGWHLQQLVKLSMAHHIKQDAMLLVDSDLFFIRRFSLDALLTDGRLPFFRPNPDYNKRGVPPPPMSQHAKKILGLPLDNSCFDYANNIVVWDRKTVLGLCSYIEKCHGKHWIVALSGPQAISEGVLYGLYVDYILKDKSHLQVETYHLVKTVHGEEAFYGTELDAFVNNIDDIIIALGFQSSARFDNDVLRSKYEIFAVDTRPATHKLA